MKRRVLLTAFVIFAVAIAVLALNSIADGDTPVVYRNDTKYSITEYPPEMQNGKLYLPVSFFVGLKGIQYEFNSKNNSFYLRNEKTGRFFSFAFDTDGIVVDNSFVNIDFPIIHSTVYLPIDYCSEILSLKVEKVTSGGKKRIRLSDSSAKLTFESLIELYDPTDPDSPPIITPENPDGPIKTDTERIIYITIDALPDTDITKTVKMLRDWGEKASFFFSKEAIKDNPESVLLADAYGNGIAVTCPESELDETNRTLYSVLGYSTRIYRSHEISDINALAERGYIVWDYTDIMSAEGVSPYSAATKIYNETFNKDITVVKLTTDKNDLKALTQLLSYVANDEHIEARVIDPTVSEINFSNTEVNDGKEKENPNN
jgi:hypothetical protein